MPLVSFPATCSSKFSIKGPRDILQGPASTIVLIHLPFHKNLYSFLYTEELKLSSDVTYIELQMCSLTIQLWKLEIIIWDAS